MAVHDPVSDLARSLTEIAGVPVVLERPGDPEHGDYATNVALRLAPTQGRPPRDIAAEHGGRGARAASWSRAPSPRARDSSTCACPMHGSPTGCVEILAAADSFGAGTRPTPERIQVEMVSANPTGPLTVATARNAAYGDSVARLLAFAGHDVEREYYYNDAGTQMERFYASVEAVRRGEEPPEDGYRGDYITELARSAGDPVPPMLARIEQTLERFRVHFDTWVLQSDVESEIPEAIALLDTFEQDDAVWARTSAHGDDKDRVLIRSDGTPGYFAADAAYVRRKYATGVRPADLRPRRRPPRLRRPLAGAGRDARPPARLARGPHLPARPPRRRRRRRRRCPSAAATWRSSTISWTRSAWMLRAGTSSREGTIRRSSSTSTSPSSERRRTPSTTCSTRTPASPGSCETLPRRSVTARARRKPAAALAREERELVKRLLEFPVLAAEAAERRAPHAIPNYAIRVADDFHRFYHEHRVLDSENQAFRLALCLATQHVVARCLDLIGVEADPDRM